MKAKSKYFTDDTIGRSWEVLENKVLGFVTEIGKENLIQIFMNGWSLRVWYWSEE